MKLNRDTLYSNDTGQIRTVVTMFNGRGGVTMVSFREEGSEKPKCCSLRKFKKWMGQI
jgi:hypothetical protein